MSAIHFGDMSDEESRPRQHLEQRADQQFERDAELEGDEDHQTTVTNWGKLSAFKLLEDLGTEPNITYIGNEPSPNAQQIDGPVAYESIGNKWGVQVKSNRKEHLNYGPSGPSEEEA
jgi:molybdopterin-containing oxidoreductase family iron-sulfur binding subunit